MLIMLAFNNVCVYVFLFIKNGTQHKLLLFILGSMIMFVAMACVSVRLATTHVDFVQSCHSLTSPHPHRGSCSQLLLTVTFLCM
jgi:hypothetical protein